MNQYGLTTESTLSPEKNGMPRAELYAGICDVGIIVRFCKEINLNEI